MEVQQLIKSLRNKHDIACDIAADLLISYMKTSLEQYQEIETLINDNQQLGKELEAYRAAEQDGTLLRLPCAVGTMVWSYDLCNCLYQGERCPYDCNSSQRKTVFNKNCLKYCEVYQFEFTINHLNDFGKTVFLTQEEAEAALKEQEGNDGK